ncbi:thioredoxin family protein [Columbia Basin potato purple top phytoplasma]|uniref:Thioredoxin family protein n=2 Tax=Columbia Basin potato purple top phytoplasma TaxID=307134 RepID=A0ABT5L837_9MOLU|nr:thioredoxin family protein [Columbia Basin potato purple top phytoplasma]
MVNLFIILICNLSHKIISIIPKNIIKIIKNYCFFPKCIKKGFIKFTMYKNKTNIDLDFIINQNKTILIDFFASWCGPCQKLMPILEVFSKENPNIKLIKLDGDLYPDYMNQYNIKSFPTLILFRDGKEIKRKIGYCSKEELISFVK